MKGQTDEDVPEMKTAGLASAMQITNVTAAATTDHSESTSDICSVVVLLPIEQEESEFLAKRSQFRKVLEKALHQHHKILLELAKR